MSKFTYTGDVELVFVDVADLGNGGTLLAKPNETYELAEAPSADFVPANKKDKPVAAVEEGQ